MEPAEHLVEVGFVAAEAEEDDALFVLVLVGWCVWIYVCVFTT